MVPTAVARLADTRNCPSRKCPSRYRGGVHADTTHRIKPRWQGRQPAAPTCTMKGMACLTPSGSIHVTSEFFQAFSATISACSSAPGGRLWAGGGVDLSGGARSARAGWAWVAAPAAGGRLACHPNSLAGCPLQVPVRPSGWWGRGPGPPAARSTACAAPVGRPRARGRADPPLASRRAAAAACLRRRPAQRRRAPLQGRLRAACAWLLLIAVWAGVVGAMRGCQT